MKYCNVRACFRRFIDWKTARRAVPSETQEVTSASSISRSLRSSSSFAAFCASPSDDSVSHLQAPSDIRQAFCAVCQSFYLPCAFSLVLSSLCPLLSNERLTVCTRFVFFSVNLRIILHRGIHSFCGHGASGTCSEESAFSRVIR